MSLWARLFVTLVLSCVAIRQYNVPSVTSNPEHVAAFRILDWCLILGCVASLINIWSN